MARLESDDTSSFYKPIKKNKVTFFKHEEVASGSREKVMKEECQLFSRLFISCQVTQCDLEDFFTHENQAAPASLSDNGGLHVSQKSQLIEILQTRLSLPEREPDGDTIIIDGSALINATPPGSTPTWSAVTSVYPAVNGYLVGQRQIV